ncbi:DgyrCDS84 [Dimorphilus gyrociliatus]|uniref:DgyrCDS84 n=1 Tax=Dimorphilus gyrociliatus TaxID=2664684 RepID=A0A7I8V528_9ANNE|nr:DgyrCDS84 [Dimorphilus gyrociliatus]
MSRNLFITILINLIITNCVPANKRDESMEIEDSIRKSIELEEEIKKEELDSENGLTSREIFDMKIKEELEWEDEDLEESRTNYFRRKMKDMEKEKFQARETNLPNEPDHTTEPTNSAASLKITSALWFLFASMFINLLMLTPSIA